MKKRKRKAGRPDFVVALVVLVLLAVVSIELVKVYGQLKTARAEEQQLTAQVQELQQENAALESDLAKAGDKDFIKDLARDKLDLVESGERVFYDVNE